MNKTTRQPQPHPDVAALRIAALRKAAHAAADAAEKAWYELAGELDVGPDRTRAFEVYENPRHARRVGRFKPLPVRTPNEPIWPPHHTQAPTHASRSVPGRARPRHRAASAASIRPRAVGLHGRAWCLLRAADRGVFLMRWLIAVLACYAALVALVIYAKETDCERSGGNMQTKHVAGHKKHVDL